MSKICIGVIKSPVNNHSYLKKEINMILNLNQLYYFDIDYPELLLDKFINESYLKFSISDNKEIDSCEMLFLPDNCFFNGISNKYKFEKKMYLLQRSIVNIVQKISPLKFELFIGESGCDYVDFEKKEIYADEFKQFSMSFFNQIDNSNINFIISGQSGQSGDG